MSFKYVSEYIEKIKIVEETKGDTKDIYIDCYPTLVAEQKNGNSRIYDFEGMCRGVDIYIKEFFAENRAVGEFDHPTQNVGQVNMDKISHKFVKIEKDEDNKVFNTRSLLLDTIAGKQAKNLIKGGIKYGISSRAFAKAKKENGIEYIKEVKYVTLGDLVMNPSAPGAFANAITENKEWIFENGVFVEKDLNESIDCYKKKLSKYSLQERSEILVDILMDYMTKIAP